METHQGNQNSTPEDSNLLEIKKLSEEERTAKKEKINQLIRKAGLFGVVRLK